MEAVAFSFSAFQTAIRVTLLPASGSLRFRSFCRAHEGWTERRDGAFNNRGCEVRLKHAYEAWTAPTPSRSLAAQVLCPAPRSYRVRPGWRGTPRTISAVLLDRRSRPAHARARHFGQIHGDDEHARTADDRRDDPDLPPIEERESVRPVPHHRRADPSTQPADHRLGAERPKSGSDVVAKPVV